MKTALIAEDHPIFRNGVKLILTYELDMYAAEAGTGLEALTYLENNQVDIVICDLDLPGLNGLDLTKQIRNFSPDTPVLIVSGLDAGEYAERAGKAGAWGFVHKNADKHKLITAIKTLLQGRCYGLPEESNCTGAASEDLPHKKLSNREYEVFSLLAAGKAVGRVADELNLSVKTVSTHRMRILQKLGCASNAEITNYALKHRLITIV